MRAKKVIAVLFIILALSVIDTAYAAEPKTFQDFLNEKYEAYKKDVQEGKEIGWVPGIPKSYEQWLQEKINSGEAIEWQNQWEKDHPTDWGGGGTDSEDKKDGDKEEKKAKGFLWAQEPSQIAIALLTLAEMFTLHKIRDDEYEMLKKWSEGEITSPRGNILKRLEDARTTLLNSPGFTHLRSDIDNILGEESSTRFPKWRSGMTIDEAKDRINYRHAQWKEAVRVYMKAMNYNTAHFSTEDKAMRDALMKLVKKPAGQTQALQAIGGFLDHMTISLERDEQMFYGLITAYIQYKLDRRDELNDLQNSVQEVAVSLKKYKPTAKVQKLGFFDGPIPDPIPTPSLPSTPTPPDPEPEPTPVPAPTPIPPMPEPEPVPEPEPEPEPTPKPPTPKPYPDEAPYWWPVWAAWPPENWPNPPSWWAADWGAWPPTDWDVSPWGIFGGSS